MKFILPFLIAASHLAIGQNLSIHGDFLYWTAQASNLDYESDHRTAIFANGTETRIRKSQSLNYQWNPGCRVGFVYQCLQGDWTHFNTKAQGEKEVDGYKTDNQWCLNLNWYDLALSTCCSLNECVSVKPYAGMRLASIHQDFQGYIFSAYLNQTIPDLPSGVVAYEVCVSEKHHFLGIGPRVGARLDWDVACGLKLFADAALSGLVGHSNHCVDDNLLTLEQRERTLSRQLVPSNFNAEKIIIHDESLQANRWIADLAVGIGWSPKPCLTFQLGYEYHVIFGQKHAHFGQDFPQPEPIIFQTIGEKNTTHTKQCSEFCRSTLSMHGLLFTIRVSY